MVRILEGGHVSKLTEDIRIATLGAAAGLLSSSVTLLVDRIDAYYTWLETLNYGPASYATGVERLWWLPVTVWHMLMTVVASLMVHRYLASRIRSPFLLWQVVGITALLGWGLTFFLAASLEAVGRGNLNFLMHELNSDMVVLLAKYVSTVFACNVFYGSVMNASSRQYTKQLDSELALDGYGKELLPH